MARVLTVAAAQLGPIARSDTRYKETVFNFARRRRPEHHHVIVERTGAEPPNP
jgi:hypothetical protein